VNVYTTCIYVYICMYVCTCACIHVHVCHVYIVCHEYIYTCIHLCVVHLDIILLFVKDGDDSTEDWKCLFENPGAIEGHELHEVLVHSKNHESSPNRVHSSDPWEERSSLLFWRDQKSCLRNEGTRLSPGHR